MVYSFDSQLTQDLNLHFRDSEKLVFITSAGGEIPAQLAVHEKEFDDTHTRMKALNEAFEVEINPDLAKFLNFTDIDKYLTDFVDMAKRGLYAYDKTKVGLYEDHYFHLVARPKSNPNNISSQNELPKIDKNIPTHFAPFDLFEYFQ